MPFKDDKDRREYQKEWARRKRAGIPTKGIRERKLAHLTPEQKVVRRRKQKLDTARRHAKKRKDLTDEILGIKCFFCGKERNSDEYSKRLVRHRKDGNAHEKLSHLAYKELKEHLETDNYVRLCYACHKAVHWCMEHLLMDWTEITSKQKMH